MRSCASGKSLALILICVGLSACLSGGGGGEKSSSVAPEELREQQVRINEGYFQPVREVQSDFLPLANEEPYTSTDRWVGVLNGAAYRVEVPENWNGDLVMYAHGFRGRDPELTRTLTVDNPPTRKYLLDHGYAWAASSYSANYFDVRAGVEDTNALALAFTDIAERNGRTVGAPDKYYITGISMGGFVTVAAVEEETLRTANYVVNYSGAAAMCGIVSDYEVFNYFAAHALSMFATAGVPSDTYPIEELQSKIDAAKAALWVDYSANSGRSGLTADGLQYYQLLKVLSGGERPIYDVGFGLFQNLLLSLADSDGTADGVLIDSNADTSNIVYRFESELGEPLTTHEINFNSMIVKAIPVDGANDLRDDGLRWIPKVNGQFNVPVVTAHGLGDLFVPPVLEQQYRLRAEANGNGDLLVQRAIRAPGHCDFSQAEYDNTLEAMLNWEQNGIKPAGDDWLSPEVVAAPDFGCTFTVDGPSVPPVTGGYPRALLAPCAAP